MFYLHWFVIKSIIITIAVHFFTGFRFWHRHCFITVLRNWSFCIINLWPNRQWVMFSVSSYKQQQTKMNFANVLSKMLITIFWNFQHLHHSLIFTSFLLLGHLNVFLTKSLKSSVKTYLFCIKFPENIHTFSKICFLDYDRPLPHWKSIQFGFGWTTWC